MMIKSAQSGEDAGCTPFSLSTITSKVMVFVSAEWTDTLPLFLVYPYIYSVSWLAPIILLCLMKAAVTLAKCVHRG
jgi:hypothetical protein